MTPPHICSLVSAWIDGVLDPEERSLFEEHWAHCPDCRQEVDHMREVKILLASVPRQRVPSALFSTLEKKYGRPNLWGHLTGFLSQPPSWWARGLVAAAVAGIALGWWNLWGPGRAEEQALALEPLLAAHAKSAGETLLPGGDCFNSTYSAQLASYEEDSSH